MDVEGVDLDPVDLGVECERHAGFHSQWHSGDDPLEETRCEGLGNVYSPPADPAIVRVEDFGAVGSADVEQRLCVPAEDAIAAAADPFEETRPEQPTGRGTKSQPYGAVVPGRLDVARRAWRGALADLDASRGDEPQ